LCAIRGEARAPSGFKPLISGRFSTVDVRFLLNPRSVFLLFPPVPPAGLARASQENSLNNFTKTLGLVTLALCFGTALLSYFWPALHAGFGAAGIGLMAVNAFAAVALLKLRRSIEPIRLVLLSMLARLSVVAAVMLLMIQIVPHGPSLYSFVFSAMAGFVVFQALEIRHLVRNPGLLAP
jgi:hypothetical protein